ncbi:uncharacterized protein LOC125944005 [Dermacentor silvarum]|uniref:uncharacterized protein LOC125944005 n=1 Tax=Dermacentor silvarum TaxID=543639 RepID=UPI0021018BF7|nr:uncharacterized protein LOC125944005 [Dermacentor silvarum]
MNDAMGCNLARFMNNKVTDMTAASDPGQEDEDNDSNPQATSDGSTAVGKQGATSRPSSPTATRHPVLSFAGSASDKLLAGFLRRPPSATPLRIQRERSLSQVEFFRVLDEKINRGKESESDDDGISRCSAISA